MNGLQYEELCRIFLARTLGVPVEQVKSVLMHGPTIPHLPEYKHQIDLYWETGDELALYLNIANAKWRSGTKVEQGEVLLLQQVKMDTRAHKAVMITNTDFTVGARSVAQNFGVALHIVRPAFDYSILNTKQRDVVQSQMHELSSESDTPLYAHEVVYRALESPTQAEGSWKGENRKIATVNRVVNPQGSVQKVAPAPGRSIQSGNTTPPQIIQRVIIPPNRGRGSKTK